MALYLLKATQLLSTAGGIYKVMALTITPKLLLLILPSQTRFCIYKSKVWDSGRQVPVLLLA